GGRLTVNRGSREESGKKSDTRPTPSDVPSARGGSESGGPTVVRLPAGRTHRPLLSPACAPVTAAPAQARPASSGTPAGRACRPGRPPPASRRARGAG